MRQIADLKNSDRIGNYSVGRLKSRKRVKELRDERIISRKCWLALSLSKFDKAKRMFVDKGYDILCSARCDAIIDKGLADMSIMKLESKAKVEEIRKSIYG